MIEMKKKKNYFLFKLNFMIEKLSVLDDTYAGMNPFYSNMY